VLQYEAKEGEASSAMFFSSFKDLGIVKHFFKVSVVTVTGLKRKKY